MIRRVVKETQSIVPVISLKGISKEDWKALPAIISSGGDVRTELVIGTHLDLVMSYTCVYFVLTDEKCCRYLQRI
jgi:hypothetical protein